MIYLLEKMIRMGELYDFYGQLLTDRQQEYMELYYRNDLSLGEIAERFQVSRAAVHDNLRRSGNSLEEYEDKLQLLARVEQRKEKIELLKEKVKNLTCDPKARQEILDLIEEI